MSELTSLKPKKLLDRLREAVRIKDRVASPGGIIRIPPKNLYASGKSAISHSTKKRLPKMGGAHIIRYSLLIAGA